MCSELGRIAFGEALCTHMNQNQINASPFILSIWIRLPMRCACVWHDSVDSQTMEMVRYMGPKKEIEMNYKWQ